MATAGHAGDGQGGAEQGTAGADAEDSQGSSMNGAWVGQDILRQRVVALIEQHCVSCHDAPGDDGRAPGITQMEWLVSKGWVVPGQGESSPLLLGFQDGHAQLERRGPTVGEGALVEAFIDQSGLDEADCRVPGYVGTDAALAAVASDIAALSADDRPFTRYLSVAYVSNAGVCGRALEDERQALFAAVNGVSTAEAISKPVPIDASELIYRLDVRNYGWDRPIDVDGDTGIDLPEGWADIDRTDFADGWSAIVNGAGPFAVEYAGPEANVLRLEAQTPVPLLPVNAFVRAVGGGDLYYALLGIGRDLAAEELELFVGPVGEDDGSSLLWAGFEGTHPNRGPREVTINRAPQNRPDRAYWLAAEQDTGDSNTIFYDLYDWDSSVRHIIFHLPNGLPAYAIERNGQRVNGTLIHRTCRGDCPDGDPLGLAACPACHAEGLLPVDNQVRTLIDASADRLSDFGVRDLADLQQYPTTAELDALRQADNAVHRDARARAGLIPGRPDPLSGIYHRFDRAPLDGPRVAAELGVSIERWDLGVDQLDPRLGALRLPAARIARSTFAELFSEAQCRLSVGARNRPVNCP